MVQAPFDACRKGREAIVAGVVIAVGRQIGVNEFEVEGQVLFVFLPFALLLIHHDGTSRHHAEFRSPVVAYSIGRRSFSHDSREP